MLPTSVHSSSDHGSPPPRPDAWTIYRGGLILRGLVACLLLWVSFQFPDTTWKHAWILAMSLAILDGLAALLLMWRPNQIRNIIRSTLVVDGVVGWGIAWAYGQSPHTMVPVLLTLFTHEILTYYPTWWGAMVAGSYILVTNGMLGIIPGLHTTPLWPWTVVIYWIAVDGLILGALLLPTHLPLRPHALAQLTAREREIYYLTVAGWATSEIAEHLHIDAGTVRSHVAHIHHKLGRSHL